jgi:sugar phosphate isomerase/epimerase
VLETRTLTDVAVLLEDNGLKYLELECLMDWFLPADDERRQASDKTRQLLFEASGALHAHHIKVTNIPGVPFEIDALTQAYAELCADAANHTDARVVYEFMPHDVNVQDLDTALQIVEGAGAPNGGLCIDTWHMTKLKIAPEELKRIPSQWLTWVELSDGQIEWMADDDHVDEVINHRALPGEGEFDIPGYIAAVRAAGYQGPWGVEVLSEELRNNPLDVICRRAHDTTASQSLERSPLT